MTLSNNVKSLLLAALVLIASGAHAEESDREYAKRVTAEAVPGCSGAARSQMNLSPVAANSVCTCAFSRMFSENSVKDLRAMEKANDREASARIMRPLMRACYESELKKAK